MSDRRTAWLAPAAFLVLAFVLTWPLFTPSTIDRRWVQLGDFSDQFYPWARYVADELAARRLPLWNPYVFGGHPFLADPQTAVLYPVSTLLALVLGRDGLSYRELELELPIHFTVAATGAYLLARRLTGSFVGGAVAGLAYGFGGFLTSYPAQQLAMLRTGAWIPLALYTLERGVDGRLRPAWLAATAIAVALLLTAGHMQSAMFAAYLLLAYAVWRGRSSGLTWRQVGLAALAPLALGAGLAAPQLLSTLELVAISTRDQLSYEAASYGYAPRALFGMFLPGWRGEKALYVGVIPLALAALALRRPSPMALFWGGVALFGLIVSVGGHTFLYRALFLFAPGWGTFRDQERTAAIWSLAVALLAAKGAARLRTAPDRDLGWWRRGLLGATGLALLLGVEALVLWTLRRGGETNPIDPLLDSAVLFLLFLALATALAWGPGRLRPRLGVALLLGLIVFDLFSVNGSNNLGNVDPQTITRREAALGAPRAENEPYRLRADDDRMVPPNYGMVWRAPMMGGDSPIQLRRTHDLLQSREEYRLWQLFNVKYLLSRAERDDPGLERVDRLDDPSLGEPGGVNVYQVRFSLPRAWAVSDVRVVPEPAAVLAAVLDPNSHPGDVAFVEQPPPLTIQPGLPRPDVSVRSVWPNGIELGVRSEGSALVVVADAWHPGWVATLNGAPTRLLRTNYAFRGVAVPAGEHVVEMRFRPTSLVYGAVVSAISVVVLVLLIALGSRRGRDQAAA